MVGATRESIALALSRMVSAGIAERGGSAFVVDTQQLSSRLNAARYDQQREMTVARETSQTM